MRRYAYRLSCLAGWVLILGRPVHGAAGEPSRLVRVSVSWGHRTAVPQAFFIKLSAAGGEITEETPQCFETGDGPGDGGWRTEAGGGDTDALACTIRYPDRVVSPLAKAQSIWEHLLSYGDPEAAGRLRRDPAWRPDPRALTVQINPEGTRGFTVTADQLLRERAFWIPECDFFVAAGDPPVSFDDHRTELRRWRGRRVLDRVAQELEATYAAFTTRWADMGNPAYENPHAPFPGHVVGVTPRAWLESGRRIRIERAPTYYGTINLSAESPFIPMWPMRACNAWRW